MDTLHAVVDFAGSPQDLVPLRLAFGKPRSELFAWSVAEVTAVLLEVDALARRGFWCVGYLRYEAAAAFEPRSAVHHAQGPLAYFSVHARQVTWPNFGSVLPVGLDWQWQSTRGQFDTGIARIQAAIASGEVYQVNYTTALGAGFGGDPFNLFSSLRRAQPHANAVYLRNATEAVLSVSPELFFDWQGDLLRCRPMKGTAPRGATPEQDQRNAQLLRTSTKERAENVMIVDLIRNDMSRVAQHGSVKVTRLFDCEPWPTVWQMTSSVAARTRPGTRLLDLFQALFPCGSVTGAPKLRAMHWIMETEPLARGVYCGAVGVVLPGGAARFNVPIRTVTVRDGRATCGIGSGITADSTPDGEWAEWTHKSLFLEQVRQPFSLLQTVRIEDGHPHKLDLHLDRLVAAAAHFGFALDRVVVERELDDAVARGPRAGRARLTVDARGQVAVELSGRPHAPGGPLRVILAPHAVAAPHAFLMHKTTRRDHYEQFSSDRPDVFDTLMWNDRGEITEFTRGNVLMELRSGGLVTPPLHCGLLDGVGRACVIAAGGVREVAVRVDELHTVRRIWFVNALRGRVPVQLDRDTCPARPTALAS